MYKFAKVTSCLSVVLYVCAASPALSQQSSSAPLVALPQSAPDAPQSATVDPATVSGEDWHKLSLKDHELRAMPPLEGETDNFPDFTRELLRVQWREGDPIDLYIVRPVGVAKPPVILYLYGYPGEAARFLNEGLCKTVTKKGFAAVGFSSMLTGQRYHDRPMKEWFVSDLEQSLVGTTHDVQMVLNYLIARGDFDTSRIGVFGEGSGGTIALLSASVDPRIKAVDVLDPWGDWPSWFAGAGIVPDVERADYLKPEFLKPLSQLDPVNLLPSLTHLPVRVQQDLWDNNETSADSRRRIAAALPPSADFVQYKDQAEYIEKAGSNGRLLEWLYSHLPAPSPAAATTRATP